MVSKKRNFLFYSLFTIFLFYTFQALAQDLNFTPTIRVTGYYYDNYKTDKKGEEKEVSFLEVLPILNFEYKSSSSQVTGTAMITKRYYYNETEPPEDEDIDQYYSIIPIFQLSDRSRLPLTFSYINDKSTTIFFSSTGESGIGDQYIQISRERRDYYVGASPTYEISELTNVGFNYGYRHAEYSGDSESNINIQNIGLFYTHHLKNNNDTFTISTNFSASDQKALSTNDFQFGVNWLHGFSQTVSLEVSFGGHFTEETSGGSIAENLDPAGGFVLKKTYSTALASIAYNFDTYTSITSGSVQIHSLNLILDWTRTEKLRLYYYSLFYWPVGSDYDFESASPDWINNSSFYGFEPAIYYKITKNFSLGFHYDYFIYPEADRERNRLWISLDYIWPKIRIK